MSNSSWGRNKKALLYGLRLDLATAPKAEPPPPGEANLDYHCKGKVWPAPLPEEWNGPENRPGDAEAGRKELADLPANTWVHRRPPMKPRARVWGKYIYDIRTHKGYAWGGGHGGYIGAEVSEYDLLTNRWRNMDDPVNYKLLWRHPSAGGSPGVSFQGWRLMGAHARKSYGVDPLSDSVITLHGDVFSITENRFVTNIGRAPGGRGLSGQEAYGTAPHGLYSYNFARQGRIGLLYRANVAAGKWDLVAKGGPANHREYDTFCHDAKRDRLVYVKSRGAAIWMFDFKTHKWSEEKPAGKSPPRVAGDTTYVHDMDAVMMVFAVEPKGEPRLHFYKLDEKKWYAAPYVGPKVGRFSQLNNSPHYDPRLKLLVRLSHYTREQFVEVAVMRLEPTTLKLAPIE